MLLGVPTKRLDCLHLPEHFLLQKIPASFDLSFRGFLSKRLPHSGQTRLRQE